MNAPTQPTPAQTTPARVTRIARRRARPGREAEYEVMLREMLAKMRAFKGFLGGDLIPPETPGEDYQLVVRFASEPELQTWDMSDARLELLERMKEVAEGEPEFRKLSGLEAWFEPAVVPASMHPPRAKMAVESARPALGTSIITGLVAQLKGTMEVRRGNGTRSEIRVPAPVLS